MSAIDPTARVEDGAVIGAQATIGPHCVIGPHAVIGEGCRLVAHVHVSGHTTIGARTAIYPFASLGTPPQSVKYRGGPTRLVIGADCDIRQGVTINIGTEDDRGVTEVGDHCFLMAGSHVGHDCQVGHHVVFANNAVLGGHVQVGDHVVFGGQAAVHQFARVGDGAMVGGLTGIVGDLIPFGLAFGPNARLIGLNKVGLKRLGHTITDVRRLQQAYRALFLGKGSLRDRLPEIDAEFSGDTLVQRVLSFIRAGSRRLTLPDQRASSAGDESP